ncbi:MAG: nucleoside recognition protein [Firmicutes bacterium]|nr:nucleoside recognition protein [Bacillota bacterium]
MPTNRLLPAMTRGVQNAVKVLWMLTKIIIPTTIIVTLMDLFGILDHLALFFSPFMSWFALPGEAAVPLVAGNISGLYAGVGAMALLPLARKQKFILATMLLLSHSLPQEGAIVAQAEGKAVTVTIIRLAMAAITGLLLNLIL